MVQILNQHLCLEDAFCPVAIATNARSWKPLWGQPYRGFESHSLRQY